MAALSASTWGDPNAPRRVLLIHSITSSSQYWYHIAREFASRGKSHNRVLRLRATPDTTPSVTGYFVFAPNWLIPGDVRSSSDYTIAALVEELRPLFTTIGGNDHPYDIVIGHLLGGTIASVLLPLLKSTRLVRVVLVDPHLELSSQTVARYRKFLGDIIRNPKTPEGYLEENPLWTKEDAIFRFLGMQLCDVDAVEAIFDQNVPWTFSHQLSNIPDNIKVTVLAADPSKSPGVREEDLKGYPDVTVKTVWGASHMIPLEFPLAVVEAALEGTESGN